MAGRHTPSVSLGVRMVVAGAAWSAAGLMLLAWALRWLTETKMPLALVLAATGVVMAWGAWLALFRGIARRNVARLQASPPRACVFAFQPLKSYSIMGAMILLGVALRHSSVPKPELAVVYLTIGGALLLASFSYHATSIESHRGAQS